MLVLNISLVLLLELSIFLVDDTTPTLFHREGFPGVHAGWRRLWCRLLFFFSVIILIIQSLVLLLLRLLADENNNNKSCQKRSWWLKMESTVLHMVDKWERERGCFFLFFFFHFDVDITHIDAVTIVDCNLTRIFCRLAEKKRTLTRVDILLLLPFSSRRRTTVLWIAPHHPMLFMMIFMAALGTDMVSLCFTTDDTITEPYKSSMIPIVAQYNWAPWGLGNISYRKKKDGAVFHRKRRGSLASSTFPRRLKSKKE